MNEIEENIDKFKRINRQDSSDSKGDTPILISENVDLTVQVENSNFAKTSSQNWRLMQANKYNIFDNRSQFATNGAKMCKGRKDYQNRQKQPTNKIQQNAIQKKNWQKKRNRGVKQRLGYDMNYADFQNALSQQNFSNCGSQLNPQMNHQRNSCNRNQICQHYCCLNNQHVNMNTFPDSFGRNHCTRNNDELTVRVNRNMNGYQRNVMVNDFIRQVHMANQGFQFENAFPRQTNGMKFYNNLLEEGNSPINNLFPTIAAISELVLKNSVQTQKHKHKVDYDMNIQRKLHLLQKKPISNLNIAKNKVFTVAGNGLDCVIIPDSTNKSLNLRFR